MPIAPSTSASSWPCTYTAVVKKWGHRTAASAEGGTECSSKVSHILLDLLSAELLVKISAGCALVLGAPMTRCRWMLCLQVYHVCWSQHFLLGRPELSLTVTRKGSVVMVMPAQMPCTQGQNRNPYGSHKIVLWLRASGYFKASTAKSAVTLVIRDDFLWSVCWDKRKVLYSVLPKNMPVWQSLWHVHLQTEVEMLCFTKKDPQKSPNCSQTKRKTQISC